MTTSKSYAVIIVLLFTMTENEQATEDAKQLEAVYNALEIAQTVCGLDFLTACQDVFGELPPYWSALDTTDKLS